MGRFERLFAALLIGCSFLAHAEVNDDFAGNDWKLMANTPGEISAVTGALILTDRPGGSEWVTATKTFDIDLDVDPVLSLKVKALTKGGEVKLLRKNPEEKHAVLNFNSPGTYNFNVREKLGWQGKVRIIVCLYSTGDESKATFEYLKFTAKPAPAEVLPATMVPARIRPALELVPLFASCGYCWTAPKQAAVEVLFRKKGAEWLKALAPVRAEEDGTYRGSVVGLDEDCDYELKLVDGKGKTLGESSFRTWSSEVPVARTVILDAGNFNGHLKIREQGRADGWIRYVAAPGFILKNDGKSPLLELVDAKYVLLDNLVLQGGDRNVIIIRNCSQVRVRNCDISGWGRVGIQRFDLDGKYYDAAGKNINYDGAILLSRSYATVVERCYIHDPRNTANSWRYSHPAGPEGLMIDRPEATVLRYNDIIGSDDHRWNDAVEGTGNFDKDGGFNRDADIYGNMMIFCNDDCIELDGGQRNVRCFLNKFEGALCGVSIQGCMSGPSYVFRNLIVNMGDQFGLAGQSIKTSSPGSGKDAVSFIFNNTMLGKGSGLALLPHLKIVAKNNIFSGALNITGRPKCLTSECDGNLLASGREGEEKNGIAGQPQFVDQDAGLYALLQSSPGFGKGVAIDNFAAAVDGSVTMGAISAGSCPLPYRPIPVELDRGQLNFTVAAGNASPPQTVTANVGGEKFSSRYTVRQNLATDWFSVSPAAGELKSGEKITFTVTLKPELMKTRRFYRGAFLIRLADGLSRPVSVYAQTDYSHEAKPIQAGVFTTYIDAKQSSGGKKYPLFDDPAAEGGKAISLEGEKGQDPVEYAFDIPSDGTYFILFRIRSETPVSEHDSVCAALNGGALQDTHLRGSKSWAWSLASIGGKQLEMLKAYKLKKGRNTLMVAPRESVYLDMIAITSDPKSFEQR